LQAHQTAEAQDLMDALETTQHLERVKDLQFAFKSDAVKRYACRVAELAADHGFFWPDEVDVELVSEEDRNCVGGVYRWLVNSGILVRTAEFRRSKAEGAKGRTIFKYGLVNEALARTFLRRNQPAPAVAGQQEFFT
jgi:hypothetical protein